MDYIISIDIGTTSTKAVAFDNEGHIITEIKKPYELQHPFPDYSEQSPEIIFNSVTESLKEVNSLCAAQGKLHGVSFSTAMHSIMCVDINGEALSPLIVWADNRAAEIAEKLKKSNEGVDLHQATGTPIHPMSPLCKIIWIKDCAPFLFNQTHKFIGIKEYIFYKLFDKYIIDHSIASATGLFNIHKLIWHAPSLKLSGIDENKLSSIVPVFHTEKLKKNEWIDKIGIPVDTPFIIGANDGCLANLGVGAIEKGNLSVTIGTSGAIRAVINKPFVEEGLRTFCYLLTENHFVVGGATNNGAIILEWLQKKILTSLVPTEGGQTLLRLAELSTMAEKVSPGSEGLIFLPYLLGERAPIYNPAAKGMYFGITINHTQAHFIRAAMEGISYAVYSIGKIISENIQQVDTIFVSGGFAHSKVWVQMIADVFGKKVILNETVESSAFGAAVIGWKALNLIDKIEKALDFIHPIESFEPDLEKHKIYMKNFEKYERLYKKLKDEF